MDSPALDKVLSTLELLDNIFSRLSRRDNTRNALVCRKWTDPARDHIWRLVETPCQLFRILAPVTCPSKSAHTNNINHTIARIPTQADWRRFRPIATRVRGLQVTAHSDTKCRASLSIILSDIAVSRPNDGILPNLRFVDLVGTSLPHGYIMLFLSLNLTSLTSSIPDDSVDYNLSDFLEDLSTSAPNLQTLSLVATRSRGHRVKTCQTALGKLPTLFPHLTCLKLPLYFLTSTVLEALADSPIVGIDFSETRNGLENAGDVRDIASINPNLRNNSLSSLHRLSICGRLRELTEMLSHEHFPAANLNDLVIRTTSAETEQAVRGLIALLAERFNSLGSLYLLLTPSSQSLGDGADPAIAWARDEDHEPLTMDTIRPLSDMRQLQRFSVLHSKPLDLDDDDIRYLTERLPNLRRLVLNPLPRARLGTPRLTLLSLMHIANHCPRIHSIALYADAASPTISYPIYIPTPLPKVYLQLSGSLLSTATRSEVAKYLSRILRPGVALKTAISVFYDVPFHVPSNGWQWITDRLSLLIDVRQEERMLQRGRQDLERQTADRTEQGTPNNTTESEEYPTH